MFLVYKIFLLTSRPTEWTLHWLLDQPSGSWKPSGHPLNVKDVLSGLFVFPFAILHLVGLVQLSGGRSWGGSKRVDMPPPSDRLLQTSPRSLTAFLSSLSDFVLGEVASATKSPTPGLWLMLASDGGVGLGWRGGWCWLLMEYYTVNCAFWGKYLKAESIIKYFQVVAFLSIFHSLSYSHSFTLLNTPTHTHARVHRHALLFWVFSFASSFLIFLEWQVRSSYPHQPFLAPVAEKNCKRTPWRIRKVR